MVEFTHTARPFASALLALAAPVVAQGGWVQRMPANSPSPRGWSGLAFDFLRDVHVLFGGSANFPNGLGDTWEWDGLDWQQRTTATVPPARCGQAMAYDLSRGRVVMFGGADSLTLTLGDTWEFDGVNWTQAFPALSPPLRQAAAMAFSSARGSTILFGGGVPNVSQLMQDTWEWNGTNWTQLATVHVPMARAAFGMTSDLGRGRVLLFGGWTRTTGLVLLSDLWSFDGVDWTQLPATQSPPGCTDTWLAADLARGMLVQFGGLTLLPISGPTNETWLHDGSDWRRDARPTSIAPRRGATLSYDWTRDRVVLFGGINSGSLWGNMLGETWEYSLAGAALWSVAGAGCAGTQGVPQLRPAGPQRAIVGTTHALEVTGGVTGGALFGLGFSDTNWNGNPLPLSLASFGMPGCELHTSLDVVSFAVAVGGTAQRALAMPNAPGLVGVRFFAQALVPQPGVNAFGAVMSNAVAEVVGAF